MAEVGVREFLCPAVQDPGQGGSLPASCWQVSLQDEYQRNVALGSKVRHVLGDDHAAFRPGGLGDLRIICCTQAHLANVDGVSAMGIAQYFGGGCREHLIDEERCHASSDSRWRVIVWLRSVMSRLRSMRFLTSSACSAA